MTEHFDKIPAERYFSLPDETIEEILTYYSSSQDNSIVSNRYKLAYDIMRLRNDRKLVERTCKLATWTMVLAVATIVLVLVTYVR